MTPEEREAKPFPMPDPDDLGTYDGHTIDVGPVSCPACKRPYVSAPTLTEEERRLRDRLHQRTMDGYEDGYAEVYVVTDDLHDALAIIDRLSASTRPAPEGLSEEGDLGTSAADVLNLLREQNGELHRRLLEAEERRDFWQAAYEEARTIMRRRLSASTEEGTDG